MTNPGPLGGDLFTPIINPPQVAILGTARASHKPVVRETEEGRQIEARLVLPLCLA
ncbi:MAG: 2-oxo acid dehydrogenase subunit E2, partial [Dehalococcoidia bacterium]